MSAGDEERIIMTTPEAPWLPRGSSAEAWVGADCKGFDPAVIVRLLITRTGEEEGEFFTVPTARGDDLPTLHLGPDKGRLGWTEGLHTLLAATVGRTDVPTRCVGYVRNVVPRPDAEYPHPTPHAHVPVFLIDAPVEPVGEGNWHTVASARSSLEARHWWPIVHHHLGGNR